MASEDPPEYDRTPLAEACRTFLVAAHEYDLTNAAVVYAESLRTSAFEKRHKAKLALESLLSKPVQWIYTRKDV